MRYRYWITLVGSLLLAIIFISAGVGKVLGHNAFLLELKATLDSELLTSFIAGVLPWVEIATGLCLLTGVLVQIASGVAAILSAAFIFHNTLIILQGFGYKPCSCLGAMEVVLGGKLATHTSLYIDIGMFVVALAVYFCFQGGFFNLKPWYLKRKKKDAAGAIESPGETA